MVGLFYLILWAPPLILEQGMGRGEKEKCEYEGETWVGCLSYVPQPGIELQPSMCPCPPPPPRWGPGDGACSLLVYRTTPHTLSHLGRAQRDTFKMGVDYQKQKVNNKLSL